MTYGQFLRKVKAIKEPWILLRGKEIVLKEDQGSCPWVALSCPQLDYDLREAIFAAADGKKGHDPKIRQDLLKATGLAKSK